jgi:hypothetical protein
MVASKTLDRRWYGGRVSPRGHDQSPNQRQPLHARQRTAGRIPACRHRNVLQSSEVEDHAQGAGMRPNIFWAFLAIVCTCGLSQAQDKVTINQWSPLPPANINLLPIPCPCIAAYVTPLNKIIALNNCTSPVAALVVRRPALGLPPDSVLSPAPNKEFAPLSLGVSEYLSLDRDPAKEVTMPHVSCPANPQFIQPTGTPRCIAPRFAQPAVVCRKDPAANVGEQCSCVYQGQAFDGQVQQVPPSPLE